MSLDCEKSSDRIINIVPREGREAAAKLHGRGKERKRGRQYCGRNHYGFLLHSELWLLDAITVKKIILGRSEKITACEAKDPFEIP